MSNYEFTKQTQVRRAFWQGFPTFKQVQGWTQNDYNATVRTEWGDFVDMLAKDGHISSALAQRVTL